MNISAAIQNMGKYKYSIYHWFFKTEYGIKHWKVVLLVTLNGKEYAMEESIIMVVVGFLLVLVLGLQIQIRNISKKIDELIQKKP